ncbi:hypothetical protein DSO57_1014058 [Entomophthora muscae]|uniref:Uncharacterized protein n=1 Tax=Entomophthora muscae TaxID=34485 RepID=A0ACC2SUD6_9FUNG|nr:hypothetical protein DSO57_1014058 [Entomophthora muscae]
MIKNITTKEIENNHQSFDHNNFPSHATATPQRKYLLVIESTQSTLSNQNIMKMVPSQNSLSQSTESALMNPHAQANVPGSLFPLPITLQAPVTKGWATNASQKAARSLF